MELKKFIKDVNDKVPAYSEFLAKNSKTVDSEWQSIPLINKKDYLLSYPLEKICWNGNLDGCHLIGASSGFSKSGTIFWPKRPDDEKNALEATENMLVKNHGLDRKKTLILVCLAFGTWIGGMQIATVIRTLASSGKYKLTVATPSLNLSESVEIYERFGKNFDQTIWLTNPSNVNLITALLKKRGNKIDHGSIFFGVVGEYFTENFREKVAADYGHESGEPFCIWTGYGSADTGDIASETRETIKLRKFFHKNHDMCKRFFGSENAPMILAKSSNVFVEIIDENIIVTKDQLIPLVRYDTKDAGGLLTKARLEDSPVPKEITSALPEEMLYVYGRASDTVIFYGTNLLVGSINDFLFSLPARYCYGGFFEVRTKKRDGVMFFNFTLFLNVEPAGDGLAAEYESELIAFLKSQSLEFNAKYDALCRSIGESLIKIELKKINFSTAALKHKYVIEEDANV
ncbi:MAG TPA: phenylacetate--CoA ligase [Candidatus Wallbacteria bacterium]|nr:phenylacetate--CoA ligase [Candidatus Wallbacteria bacterium]